MPSPSSTSSSRRARRSLWLGAAVLAVVQAGLYALDLNSPTFFGNQVVSQKYTEALRMVREGPIDVVAVGHSHTVNGFDPAVFEEVTGLRAYNFGLPGTDMQSHATVLRDFVIPHLKPRIVLWNLDPVFGERAVQQSNRRMLSSDAFAVQSWPGGHALLGPLKDLFLYQKRSVDGWFETLADPYVRRYDRSGFMPVYQRLGLEEAGVEYDIPADWLARKRRWRFPVANAIPRRREPAGAPVVVEGDAERREEARATVAATLAEARAAGIEVLAFAAPMARRRFMVDDEFTREITTEGTGSAAWFAELVTEHELPFVNYGYFPPISDDDDLYYNDAHVNVYGARLLTERLARDLVLREEPVPPELRGFPSPLQRRVMEEFRAR